MKRTKLSICIKKKRYARYEDAVLAIQKTDIVLRPYKCDRGDHYHVTSRTKGKWMVKTSKVNI